MAQFDDKTNLIEKIKALSPESLQALAGGIRQELLEDVSLTGGHLASNLGVVELTLAIHKVFDSPKDKIIWDVGHQCYVHKMLTGRRSEMKSIRTFGGISGFPKRSESVHDAYDSGHSGTSVSAALGYAKARDLAGDDYSCVAVIGDGALTGGVAYEALNHAGSSKTPLIVILNDNQMSIGKSVGGTTKYLNKMRTSKLYNDVKNQIKENSDSDSILYQGLTSVRDAFKSVLLEGGFFEELGFKYFGPIDGHNVRDLVDALEFAKKLKRPVLVHVVTKKGKGYSFAEENPARFHGTSAFDISDPKVEDKHNTWSSVFGDELLKLAANDEKIVAVSAAMVDATGLSSMQSIMPERVFDVGIAEQHAVSFAAGLALGGYKPVVAIYSTFLQRAYDQIVTEVCLQNLPVVFAIDRAGVTGSDGETHQGIFDISYLSAMPNMTILSPNDEKSFRSMLSYALKLNTPCALRYPKGILKGDDIADPDFVPSYKLIKDGEDVLIISDGGFAEEAAKAADLISNANAAVCALEVLKPLDKELISEMLQYFKAVITIEDGTIIGGFGAEVSRIAAEGNGKARVLNLGWPDKFIEHGSITQLRKKYMLDAEGIAKQIEEFIEDKIR